MTFLIPISLVSLGGGGRMSEKVCAMFLTIFFNSNMTKLISIVVHVIIYFILGHMQLVSPACQERVSI